jgi:hypothetical protein
MVQQLKVIPLILIIFIEGQVWYDKTNKVLQYVFPNLIGTWSTGGSLNQSRTAMGAAGTQTAGIVAAGHISPANTNKVELYDGSSWTETADVNTTKTRTRWFWNY